VGLTISLKPEKRQAEEFLSQIPSLYGLPYLNQDQRRVLMKVRKSCGKWIKFFGDTFILDTPSSLILT
jgi:hypothetical protein